MGVLGGGRGDGSRWRCWEHVGVGVVAAVAAMTVVIALVDLLLQSSREMAELYEGRSVTMRLTLENSAAQRAATGRRPAQVTDSADGGAPAASSVTRPEDTNPGK